MRRIIGEMSIGDVNKIADRFWAKVDVQGPDDCWNWKAHCNPVTGYGQFGFRRAGLVKTVGAHVLALELDAGGILHPDHETGHTCANRTCCNPRHLVSCTHQENMDELKARDGTGANRQFTPYQVIQIRRLLELKINQGDIAKQFNCHPVTISHINCNRIYKSSRFYEPTAEIVEQLTLEYAQAS